MSCICRTPSVLLLLVSAVCSAAAERNYVLGPDDSILIRSPRVKEVDEKRFSVSKEGVLDLPMIGAVQASGLEIAAIRQEIDRRFNKYYYEPSISLEIADFKSQPVSVLGSVARPGIYQMQGRKNVAEMLSLAGGPAPDAGYTISITRRGSDGVEQISHYDLGPILNGQAGANVDVEPRDVITVPRAALIYVIGDVHKPGGFTLADKERASLLQALALAEGALPTAALKNCIVLRPKPGSDQRERMPVNVSRLMGGKTNDVLLQAGDVLVVPSNTARKVGVKAAEAALQTASGLLIWRRP